MNTIQNPKSADHDADLDSDEENEESTDQDQDDDDTIESMSEENSDGDTDDESTNSEGNLLSFFHLYFTRYCLHFLCVHVAPSSRRL